MKNRSLTRGGLLLLALAASAALLPPRSWALAPEPPAKPDPQGTAFFERHVRPVLVERCYGCHSAKSARAQGGLLLDSRAGWMRGGASGAVLVPGDPEKSLLIRAVRHAAGAKPMPPAGKLPEREVEALVEWVRRGAPDPRTGGAPVVRKGLDVEQGRKHWAFQPLAPGEPPAVKLARWPRNAVDRYVLSRLEARGLRPSPYADRRTLARRAALVVTGMPPAPEEVEAFVNDRSPDAWEKVVDRLLASPRYGERWGRHWLDLARFAESHGFEHDYDRPNAYHYRDFVIRALNADMPYDQFVRWQIAGDELAPDDPLALAATGFLAAGVHSTQITASQVEKERYDELDDMVSTIGTSMLGLTLGCARCHDHKYDPVPTKDYYRLVATFTTTVRSDYDVDTDPAGYRAARAAWEREHAPRVDTVRRYEAEQLPARLDEWLRAKERPERAAWLVLEPHEYRSAGGATLTPQADGSVLASGKNPDTETYTLTARTGLTRITALRVEALAHPSLVKGGPGRAANGNFALSDLVVTAAPASGGPAVPLKLDSPTATFEQAGLPARAAIDPDRHSAWAVDPQFGKDHAAVFPLAEPAGFPGGTLLTFTLRFECNTGHSMARPRLSLTTDPVPVALDGPARPEPVERALRQAASGAVLTPEERGALLRWYRTRDPEWQRLDRAVQEHLALAPKPAMRKMLISSEGVPAVRLHTQGGDFLEQTHFLKRGDPSQKGEVATPGFLQVLSAPGEPESRWQQAPPAGWRTSYRRRGLAAWITDTEAGAGRLLARVIVNRLWQHQFGRGLVATPSDFGTQGERPTHPELLDFLASELIRGGWRLKPIHRLMLTSAVFMQAASAEPGRMAADPENRLFGRWSRRRLEAEAIRDSLLAVSGLLDPTMYGPGSLDEGMKRRSIYFTVKRSRLVPFLQVWDAPDALQGLAARPATTVAPQALLMLNNPQVAEYARGFARRVAAEATPEGRVALAYRTALSRPPTAAELADGIAFLRSQEQSYQESGQTQAGERAVADFCRVLFSLNEFLYVQ